MKLQSVLLTHLILAISLSACGAPQTQFLPRAHSFQSAATPPRLASGQLTYADEMRGFSSSQNPMRTMRLEYTNQAGQTISMHADRFLKTPEFLIGLRTEAAKQAVSNPHKRAQYFSSLEKAKVQALFDSLRQLDTQAAEMAHKEALGRILDHLKSAL